MTEILPIVDSHCHIDFPIFDSLRSALLRQCAAQGMQAIVVPGVKQTGWDGINTLCRQYEMLFPCYGLHPCFMSEHKQGHLEELPGHLDKDAIGVGEIGLDAFIKSQDFKQQLKFFEAQLAIAKQLQLPVVIHARKTHDLIAKSVRKLQFKQGGIVHAFSGSLQQAQVLVGLGFKLGFGGAATYDRATKLRSIFKSLPDNAIVLETDAPDIAPVFAKGECNAPTNLFQIARILSEVRNCSSLDLAMVTSRNVAQVFSLDLTLLV